MVATEQIWSTAYREPVPEHSGKPKFEVDRSLFPYEPHYLVLESGARVHYVDEGTGPALLLLHGNPTWSFVYRHLIAELRNTYRVVVPDYPGFGLSTAPGSFRFSAEEQANAMIEFVCRLDLCDMTIMMQDWGGPIGFAIAERYPERVAGFVVGNTWAWPIERFGQRVFSTLMGGWPGRVAAWSCNGVVRFFLSRGVVHSLSSAELSMYLAPFSSRTARRPTHIFPAQLRGAGEFLQKVHDNLPPLCEKPALLVWGSRDFAFRNPERERFEKLFRHHETVLLDRAGHFVQEDAPVEIASAIQVWSDRNAIA